ncbi:MAG TPA: acyltransferase [Flavobacteriales bacterium]|nr:acyltransferase [Flavobacteriales bacterium]
MDHDHPLDRARLFGLDLMRAVAITLVVISHADDLLGAYWPSDTGVSNVDGVDLFFVLSGYLIGGILLRYAEMTDVPWSRRSIDFWQRRWLRTLPNYFLFLVLNILLLYLGLAPGLLNVNALAYFVFLQNFMVPLDLFFWESWSLAVEEWFYLLLPILIFILIGVAKRSTRSGFLMAICVMVGVSTILRFPAMDVVATPFNLDLLVRKIVVLRMDTIGFGVLAAWVHHYYPALWHQRRPEVFGLGILGLTTATLLHTTDSLMFNGTWYFTLSAISMALFLPALSGWERTGRWGRPIVFLSRISYALYLVHLPVRHLYEDLLIGRSMVATVLLYGGYWLVCLLLATGVYLYWERPFMALRKGITRKLLPSNAPLHR